MRGQVGENEKKPTNKVVKVDIIYVYTLCVCCVPTSISRSKAVCTFI